MNDFCSETQLPEVTAPNFRMMMVVFLIPIQCISQSIESETSLDQAIEDNKQFQGYLLPDGPDVKA